MKVGGRNFDLTKQEVEDRMTGEEPELIQKHMVEVNGRMFPPKQVLGHVTGWARTSFTTMEATVSNSVEEPRFLALLFGVFGGLAVCLAIAGVYGLMSYAVQQRSKEVGLRMALGAGRWTVLRLMLRQAFVLAAIGLTIGFAAAIAGARVLSTVLFEVQPLDAVVFPAVIALLGLVTLAAAYLPARRAAVLDPVEVLKAD